MLWKKVRYVRILITKKMVFWLIHKSFLKHFANQFLKKYLRAANWLYIRWKSCTGLTLLKVNIWKGRFKKHGHEKNKSLGKVLPVKQHQSRRLLAVWLATDSLYLLDSSAGPRQTASYLSEYPPNPRSNANEKIFTLFLLRL